MGEVTWYGINIQKSTWVNLHTQMPPFPGDLPLKVVWHNFSETKFMTGSHFLSRLTKWQGGALPPAKLEDQEKGGQKGCLAEWMGS